MDVSAFISPSPFIRGIIRNPNVKAVNEGGLINQRSTLDPRIR